MDKNAIKKYAVWARVELIKRVSQKALQYGITSDRTPDPGADSVNGRLLSDVEKRQRQALIRRIERHGYTHVMEEVAYTWFNRFAALRFMEVNGYLPTHVRVFTDEEGNFKPQILSEAIHLELEGLDMEKVYALKNANMDEELFKYLLILQCNALSKILPGMFQQIEDYTELLLPDYLLREGSPIQQMIALIPEEDWKDQVQIIGWLYQYYNTEPKDKVFSDLKKNIKIQKENIPAATQLFTPDWIVRYMVENSLGRLWLSGHPNDSLKSSWKYYLSDAPQEPEVQDELDSLSSSYAALKPEDILCIDPCMGSGHILCYLFDVLVQIYESYGYTAREAAASIVKNNLWGLDIDERAAQLAYFAVMMKARQYDRRFFSRNIQPHIYPIEESNSLDGKLIEYFCAGRRDLLDAMIPIVRDMYNAKEFGSLLSTATQEWDILYPRFAEIEQDISIQREPALRDLLPVVQAAQTLSQKYHVVVTNPPYMAGSNASPELQKFIKQKYPDSKADLFAVFMERCGELTRKNGFQAMITQHSWMFLSSFEKLRAKMRTTDIVNMAHLGARAFEEIVGEVVQTTTFVLRRTSLPNFLGTYCRLVENNNPEWKEQAFLLGRYRYTAKQSNFSKIPGSPVAYWVSDNFIKAFDNKLLDEYTECAAGVSSGKNDYYLKLWFEPDFNDIAKNIASNSDFINSKRKYAFCNKGGDFRKWYGNNEYVAFWIKQNEFHRNGSTYTHLLFKKGMTWSAVTSGNFSSRYYPNGYIFDHASPSLFSNEDLLYFIGLSNSATCSYFLKFLNPTINMGADSVRKLPVIFPTNHSTLTTINSLVEQNISLSKADWDAFETSWDFKRHPLVGR